ncbi:MAG: thioredoxin family protein [Acholeplasmatales bacterium]|nr:thioredoxin family protein [Acholeplasmatales bacterium]
MIIDFTKDLNFKEIVNNNDLVFFDFRMDNCCRCDSLEAQIKDYLKTNDILVYKVDVKENMKLVRSLNIYASPCLMMYKNHELVHRNLGTFSFDEFIELL